jgi:hypothetical protein
MKLQKILLAVFIFAGSILAFASADASAVTEFRVRTVPSSADAKKKEAQKATPVNSNTTTTTATQKDCNQTKLLQSTLWIGNGGKPK